MFTDRRPSSLPLIATLAALLLALIALPVARADGAASPITWGAPITADSTVDPQFGFTVGFASLSCPTTTFCVAGSAAYKPTGSSTYKVDIATSSAPGVAGSWKVTTLPASGSNDIVGMSCPTTTLCVGVDAGRILSSTDPSGDASAWRFTAPTANTGHGLTSVSCPSATQCEVVDGRGAAALSSATPASGNWTTSPTPSQWTQVSCTSTLCAATSGPSLYTGSPGSTPATWTEHDLVPYDGSSYQGSLNGVACLDAGCLATDSGSAFVSDGIRRSATPNAAGTSSWSRITSKVLDHLSCTPGSVSNLCVGWTQFGDYVTSSTSPITGTSADWATQDVANAANSDGIGGVSCPTVSTCVAVTTKGMAFVGTDGTGSGSGGTPTPTPTPTPSDPGSPAPAGPTPATPAPSNVGAPAATPTLPASSTSYPGADLLTNNYPVTDDTVTFALNSEADANATLAAQTFNSYVVATGSRATAARAATKTKKPKKKPVTVGSAKFTLKANVKKTVKLTISKAARTLLAAKPSLKVKVTITAKTTAGVTKTTVTTVTLKAAKTKAKAKAD